MYLVKWQPQSRSLAQWDPFAEVTDIHRWFDHAVGELFGRTPFAMATAEAVWSPLVDVHETKDEFQLKVELPGVKQEDVKVSIVDDTLTLKGERKRETEMNEEGYHRIERSYGTFQRSVVLPSVVDVDGVKATFKDGVLEIRLPKKEEAKPKAVKIDVA